MTVEIRRAVPPYVLAAGDTVALILFSIIGLASHDEGITFAGVARNSGPILVAFMLVSIVAGTYAHPGLRTLLVTWAIAIPIGVAVRAIWLNRPADGSQVVFGIVTMIVTLILLLAWRGIAGAIARARGR